jgi:hypothetical protein
MWAALTATSAWASAAPISFSRSVPRGALPFTVSFNLPQFDSGLVGVNILLEGTLAGSVDAFNFTGNRLSFSDVDAVAVVKSPRSDLTSAAVAAATNPCVATAAPGVHSFAAAPPPIALNLDAAELSRFTAGSAATAAFAGDAGPGAVVVAVPDVFVVASAEPEAAALSAFERVVPTPVAATSGVAILGIAGFIARRRYA